MNDDFPAIREYMRNRDDVDNPGTVEYQLRTLNLILFTRTYPFDQPKLRDLIESRLGL